MPQWWRWRPGWDRRHSPQGHTFYNMSCQLCPAAPQCPQPECICNWPESFHSVLTLSSSGSDGWLELTVCWRPGIRLKIKTFEVIFELALNCIWTRKVNIVFSYLPPSLSVFPLDCSLVLIDNLTILCKHRKSHVSTELSLSLRLMVVQVDPQCLTMLP